MPGEPGRTSDSFPDAARSTRALPTSPGAAAGRPARYGAAAPAAWGDAIEVPQWVALAVSPVCEAEVTPTPGANRSSRAPQSEKYALASPGSLAPTVIASSTRAGESAVRTAVGPRPVRPPRARHCHGARSPLGKRQPLVRRPAHKPAHRYGTGHTPHAPEAGRSAPCGDARRSCGPTRPATVVGDVRTS